MELELKNWDSTDTQQKLSYLQIQKERDGYVYMPRATKENPDWSGNVKVTYKMIWLLCLKHQPAFFHEHADELTELVSVTHAH